jgi:hypothetical protein
MYKPSAHDIAIVDPVSGLKYGLVLKRDDNNEPYWREMDTKSLADYFTTSPTQYSTDPEKSLVLGQTDWSAGAGLEYEDTEDPKRYFNSIGMDLRHKGMAMAGWTATAVTKPDAHTVGYVSPASGSGTSWTDIAYCYDGDTDTNAICSLNGSSWGNYLELECDEHHYCDAIRFSATYDASSISKIDIDVSIEGSWVDVYEGSYDTHTYVTKNLTSPAIIQKCRVRFYNTHVSGQYAGLYELDFHIADYAVGVPACHATFNDDEYVSFGTYLAKLNVTGDEFTRVRMFPANITALVPFQISGTDYLFIFLGTSNAYWYMTTAEVFTESTLTTKSFQYGAWVNTTVDTLYANDSGNTIRSNANPINGGDEWSSQTIVGSAADAITHMEELSGALLIDKEDMPYYLDSSGNVQKDLAPECVSGRSTHSGKNSTIWQNVYYRPTGDQALLASGTVNEWIQPARYTTNNATMSGQVEACAGDEEWLYVVTDNSTAVEVQCTREQSVDGDTRRVWHPLYELTLAGCETAWISTVFQKRLYISSTSVSDSLYYIPLPTKYGNITSDDNRVFKTGTYFETAYLHGGFPTEDKAIIKLTCTMGHTYNAGRYFNVNYKLLGDSTWSATTLKFDGSSSSMIETQYFEVANTSRVSPMIRLKFTAVTDDTDYTPILLDYKIDTVLTAPVNKVYWAKVRVGDGVSNLEGTDSNKYSDVKTCLERARANTWVTEIRDMDGNTRYVKLLPNQSSDNPFRKPVRKEKNKVIEWEYNLLMLDIPLE